MFKQIQPSGHNVHDYLSTSQDCTIIKRNKTWLSQDIHWNQHMMIQPQKNMTTMGKVDILQYHFLMLAQFDTVILHAIIG